MPKITVLLATYNRSHVIEGAIKSVLDQTFKDWELIISDDSKDGRTEELVKKFEQDDERIKYFRHKGNGTIGNNSNFALSHATGEYVAILDDDDRWIDPEKLKKQNDFLDSHEDYIACGGGIIVVNEKGNELSRVLKPETDVAIRHGALSANPMANSTTMFRRAEAGSYDETIRQLADWDFYLRLGKKGKLYNFPEYFLAYMMWDEGISFKNQKENASWGKKIVLRYKNDYPGFLKAIFLAEGYIFYAHFPEFVRRFLNGFLSRLKKYLFSR